MGNSSCTSHNAAYNTAHRMEADRQQQQAALKAMVTDGPDVDWPAVIAYADQCHRAEQAKLRQANRRRRRRRRSNDKTKDKTKVTGSYSVNLLLWQNSQEDSQALLGWRRRNRPSHGSVATASMSMDQHDDWNTTSAYDTQPILVETSK